jgi:hypothetical protein
MQHARDALHAARTARADQNTQQPGHTYSWRVHTRRVRITHPKVSHAACERPCCMHKREAACARAALHPPPPSPFTPNSLALLTPDGYAQGEEDQARHTQPKGQASVLALVADLQVVRTFSEWAGEGRGVVKYEADDQTGWTGN